METAQWMGPHPMASPSGPSSETSACIVVCITPAWLMYYPSTHSRPLAHPPPYPWSDNLLTWQHSALTLWESTPRLCLSATSSKDPPLFLSALLWIYEDFCLYYSSDTSLWKHFPCHSVHVYWTHFCTWYCLSGWGFKNTLKFMVSTLSFGFAWMGVISSSCL